MHSGEPFDFWHVPARIDRNRFKFKSLSCWSFNISVGCAHACRFCYVPSTATNKQKPVLARYGVHDPDAEWGDYSLLRPWDEKVFRASLAKAENTDPADLNPDGNRAVIYCSTTDPYQIFHASTPEKTKLLNTAAFALVERSLELILEESTLNVRILTRSPLARKHFDLFKRFGNRLLFGMSLPTLDNDLARIYEPRAPAPSKRLETLKAAREAGLNVYVAVAPVYPECGAEDLRRTFAAVKELRPATIFHEPINIRAENIPRIEAHAHSIGRTVRTEVFHSKGTWFRYAVEALHTAEKVAREVGVLDRLHLWPDRVLKSEKRFLNAVSTTTDGSDIRKSMTTYEKKRWEANQHEAYLKLETWIDDWHARRSKWPGQNKALKL